MKAISVKNVTNLRDIPNIGVSIEKKLLQIGVLCPQDLIGKDPTDLYKKLSEKNNTRYDPCLLDAFMAAVAFMESGSVKPWWFYTKKRKKQYPNI